ncbi:alpha/beta hydrolase [Blastomyces dermatitidis ATCC 18188]|uniref:Alpha/beta hydrolase n=1 Tax=Ajellomyces dermatitidis (strain ATCC 18188 / CBS 674.68) TaxID=653446 RepID=F2TBW1_AJEDA|nr:alpha/beta hydrolase [Blastomyces dermatitidis ATCC 18188]
MAPGLLYITMQPRDDLSPAKFHDWYNNEHGPSRLRLPFITNGFRFRATDTVNGSSSSSHPLSPEWLAIYDVTDMAELKCEPYLRLRRDEIKSKREKEVMAKITIDRRLYDFVESKEVEGYVPLDALTEGEAEAEAEGKKNKRVLVAIIQTLYPDQEEEFNKWYREEHLPLLSRVPGWLRTRRFVSSAVEPTAVREYLSLHEYESHDGPSGPELKAVNATPWRERVMANMVKDRSRRVYEHYYTFTAAPRDLASLSAETEKGATTPFLAPDGLTKTFPTSSTSSSSEPAIPAIQSYIKTPDGVTLPYRLEGSTNPNAPLIILSNSILTHYRIWDDFIATFFSPSSSFYPSNRQYRILRYLTRGRSSNCGQQPITLDVLAADIITILDALRVPKAAALIGVSLGGATVLNTALKYPERVGTFIACDTNAKSPDENSKVWAERIALAEAEGALAAYTDEPIVGGQLAEVTVRRWFVRGGTCDGGKGELEGRFRRVKEMVKDNSLGGFRRVAEALFQYDLREEMGRYRGAKGAFLVGDEDGVLPKTMREMVGMMGRGDARKESEPAAEFLVVEGAGHLPMVEKPERFEELVSGFLGQREVGR